MSILNDRLNKNNVQSTVNYYLLTVVKIKKKKAGTLSLLGSVCSHENDHSLSSLLFSLLVVKGIDNILNYIFYRNHTVAARRLESEIKYLLGISHSRLLQNGGKF